jgi:hypothetical protein
MLKVTDCVLLFPSSEHLTVAIPDFPVASIIQVQLTNPLLSTNPVKR